MIELNFSDNEKTGALEDGISEGAPEHGFFVSDVLDDVWGKPGGNRKGEIYEKDGSLSEVLVSIVVIEFGDHVLQWIKRGEHDHETDAEIRHSEILLAFGESVLLDLWHC